jgi:hypothetical protein
MSPRVMSNLTRLPERANELLPDRLRPTPATGWAFLAGATAFVVGLSLRSVVAERRASRHVLPWRKPHVPDTSWLEALGWATVGGIGAAVGQLLVRNLEPSRNGHAPRIGGPH